MGSVVDMTEDADLAILDKHRALILAATGDGVWGLDSNGHTTFSNPAAERMTGFTLEDMKGRPSHEIIHHSHADGTHYPQQDCPIYAAFNDGKVHRVSGEVFWRKDGTSFPVEYVSTPLIDDDEIVGAVVAFRDITDQVHAQAALRESEKRARRLQADLMHGARLSAMGELASGIAHELNQPLTAVMNYLNACQMTLDQVPENLKTGLSEYLQKAVEQADRAGRIIASLRSFVQNTDAARTAERLNEIVSEASSLVLSGLASEDIAVEMVLADDLPTVCVDRIQIQQVVFNLVRNAVEAMAGTSDGRLKIVTTAEPDGMISVSIVDTGVGVDQEMQEKLFNAFSTTKEDGMGVGLSICKSIIEDHDGEIGAKRNEGRGTTFTFSLPVLDRDAADA